MRSVVRVGAKWLQFSGRAFFFPGGKSKGQFRKGCWIEDGGKEVIIQVAAQFPSKVLLQSSVYTWQPL